MSEQIPCWGVYRVLASGAHKYVSRSATQNQKLAMEIASDLSIGRVIRPDGTELWIPAHPHICKLIETGVITLDEVDPVPPEQLSRLAQSTWPHPDLALQEPDAEEEAALLRAPVTVNVAGHEHPVPKGWDHIPADDDITVTLTRAELRALIHACSIADDEGQLDESDGQAVWLKLVSIMYPPAPACPHCGYRHPPDGACV